METQLLELLCCPETHQGLRLAEPALVAELNRRIAAGALRDRAGRVAKEAIEGGLVRADGQWLYPIRRQIPVMLVDEAIPLAG
jgi:uncharacterized protein YbaR (Trm112 family)